MENTNILFIGLPNTGKTTYLAALWYTINNAENCTLKFKSLGKGSNKYINDITKDWIECKKFTRTNLSGLETVQLNIINSITNIEHSLFIPDITGETFQQHFATGQWDLEFYKLINDCEGLMLFIDPYSKDNLPDLQFHRIKTQADLGYNLSDYNNSSQSESKTNYFNSWQPNYAPNQIKLVDFLESVNYFLPNKLRKLSVIISAWDIIEVTKDDDPIKPIDWIKQNLPLLSQYLICNGSYYSTEYFGVSAQGGEYPKEGDSTLCEINPLNRIKVFDGITSNLDITAPIVRLIS